MSALMTTTTEADIWLRTLWTGGDELSPDNAQRILGLGFAEADQKRAHELGVKANRGTLTPEEQRELDDYLHVNMELALMQAKVRLALRREDAVAA